MADLIPRDAAIMAIMKQIGEGTEQWVQGNNSAVYACRASLRAIPAIDPATIREAALREAADIAISFHQNALEWAKTIRGLDRHIKETDSLRISAAILSLIGEKK